MDAELKKIINKPTHTGFAIKINNQIVDINGVQTYIVEILLDCKYKKQKYYKLIYATDKCATDCNKHLVPEGRVTVRGRHVIPPYDVFESKYLTDKGILQVRSISFEADSEGRPLTKSEFFKEMNKKHENVVPRSKRLSKEERKKVGKEIPDWIEIIPPKGK